MGRLGIDTPVEIFLAARPRRIAPLEALPDPSQRFGFVADCLSRLTAGVIMHPLRRRFDYLRGKESGGDQWVFTFWWAAAYVSLEIVLRRLALG